MNLDSDSKLSRHFMPHQVAWIQAENAIDEVWTFEVRNFITPVRSNAHFLNGHSSEKIEAAKSSNANVTSFLDFMRLFGPEKSA